MEILCKLIHCVSLISIYTRLAKDRIGLGRQLFEAMLSCESKFAHQLGYDRPSSKLLSFLGKFYSLKRFLPQANQFVVFTAYFDRNNDNAMVSKPTTQRPNCHCIKTNRGPCVCSFLDVRPSQDKAIIHGRRTNTINLLETASEKVTLKSSGQNILKQEFGDKESTNTIDSGHKNKSILKENLSKSTKMSSTITDIHESEAFGHHSEFCNEGRVFLVSKNNSEDTGHVAFGHGYEKAGSNNRPSSLFTNRINRFSLKPCEINKSKENIQLCSAKKQLSNISPFYNKASPSILDHEDQRTNRGGTFNRTEDNHDLNILGTFQPGHTLERRSAESSNWRREYNSTLSADLDPQACGKCKKTEEKSQPADILFTKQELSDISNMCNKDPYCKLNSDQLTNRIGSQTSPRSRYLAELSGCGAAAALGLSRPIKKSGSL
ncbi:hypothetical protein O6H91_14G004100 [Diphasiastrum complanatum]|uniref:Uncharacterized protein n=1 Tax=Diphasiastrum complanatum TaxID=34168 RepID=A0ACC2BKZ6_DIPCM|nr:hypothetical protein O6H91_14G004100 [Diphasiastrum complanatum]